MSLHRRAAKRDGNEREIITALEARGATVQRLSAKGVPDLLVGFQTHNILIEVKMPKADLTKDESEWHQWFNGTTWVVYSAEMALKILDCYAGVSVL